MSADPNPIPLYAQLDLWMALGGDAGEFDAWREERSFADAWAELLAAARTLRTRTPDWTAPASGMPRPPAEEPRERSGADSGSTGVPEPHARPETASERIEQIRTALADLDEVDNGVIGVKGRYGWSYSGVSQHVNMHADLKWLLDHVNRLGAIRADEVPDVDGWTIRVSEGALLVSSDAYPHGPALLTSAETPVGAVLAFIADQEGQADV